MIITINSHQPYLYLFSKIMEETIVIDSIKSKYVKKWDKKIRPLPDNFNTLSWEDLKEKKIPKDSICLAHNIADIIQLKELKRPIIFLIHSSLSGRIYSENSKININHLRRSLNEIVNRLNITVVAISEFKAIESGLKKVEIIKHGIIENNLLWKGNKKEILMVANNIPSRAQLLGYDFIKKATEGLNLKIVGKNNESIDGKRAKSYDDLIKYYLNSKVLIHFADPKYEDGYNLSVLEALSVGMPVITRNIKSSPNAVFANISNPEEARDLLMKILEERLEINPIKIKENATDEFSIEKFISKWKDLLTKIRGK